MALTALPKGWVLESGSLSTDLDEETSNFRTGSRAIRFLATSGTTRMLSKVFAVTDGAGGANNAEQRRNIGVTAWIYAGGSIAAADIQLVAYWYDSAGAFISSNTVNAGKGAAGSGKWYSVGNVFIPTYTPSAARFGRVGIQYSNASEYMILDNYVPYVMPPFGTAYHTTITHGLVTSVPGGSVQIPMTLSGLSFFKTCHGAKDDTATYAAASGEIVVNETGVYTMSTLVDFTAYDANDAFQLRVTDTVHSILVDDYGTVFIPGLAKSAMSPQPGWDLHESWCRFLVAGSSIKLWLYQYAGSARTIDRVDFHFQKDN